MVLVLVISRSSKRYNTLFSTDPKAKKRTITTTYLVTTDGSVPAPAGTTTTVSLVAADDGALTPASITTTTCLVTADDGIPANVYLTDSGVPAPVLSLLT
jgi:hypothetical protein